MHTGREDRLWNWSFSQLLDLCDLDLDLTFDWVIRHTIVYHSLTYIHTKFRSNQKNFLWWADAWRDVCMYGWTLDKETSFISSIRRSWPQKAWADQILSVQLQYPFWTVLNQQHILLNWLPTTKAGSFLYLQQNSIISAIHHHSKFYASYYQ